MSTPVPAMAAPESPVPVTDLSGAFALMVDRLPAGAGADMSAPAAPAASPAPAAPMPDAATDPMAAPATPFTQVKQGPSSMPAMEDGLAMADAALPAPQPVPAPQPLRVTAASPGPEPLGQAVTQDMQPADDMADQQPVAEGARAMPDAPLMAVMHPEQPVGHEGGKIAVKADGAVADEADADDGKVAASRTDPAPVATMSSEPAMPQPMIAQSMPANMPPAPVRDDTRASDDAVPQPLSAQATDAGTMTAVASRPAMTIRPDAVTPDRGDADMVDMAAATPPGAMDRALPEAVGEAKSFALSPHLAKADGALPSPLLTQALVPAGNSAPPNPYPVVPQSPAMTPIVQAQPGRIGADIGVEIARAAKGDRDDLLIRLDPRDMGRVDVRLSFDRDGILRAVMSADSPAALDMLRRESADLNRALGDAGIRHDAQSLRFDSRSGDQGHGSGPGTGSGQGGQRGQQSADSYFDNGGDMPADAEYRPLRASGLVDLMA